MIPDVSISNHKFSVEGAEKSSKTLTKQHDKQINAATSGVATDDLDSGACCVSLIETVVLTHCSAEQILWSIRLSSSSTTAHSYSLNTHTQQTNK
jgi:uncharacterized membrane protein